MKLSYLLFGLALTSMHAVADSKDSTLDAAIGGALGGAIGAAVGNEVGGRQGAIIGGGIGGATGAAVTTDGESSKHHHSETKVYVEPARSSGFCPPGQAKKGNC